MKIGIKLTVVMILLSLVSVCAVGVTSLLRARTSISQLSVDYVQSVANNSATEIKNYLDMFWYSAETSGLVMEQYEQIVVNNRRDYINRLLRAILENNQAVVSTWAVWDHDILEGNDMAYLDVPGTDVDGRFVPYWYQLEDGSIHVEPLVDYDTPGEGDYHLLAKNSGRTMIIDPYYYVMGGKTLLFTTISVPIHSGNTVVGVVGIDIALDEMQAISQTNKPFGEKTVTAVFSNNGTICAHFDTNLIGKPMTETERDMAGPHFSNFQEAVKKGAPLSYSLKVNKENVNFSVIPIHIGASEKSWSYVVGIANETIMAPVYKMTVIAIIISVAMLVVVIVAATFLSHSISRPIVEVAETLKDISEGAGDLTRNIPVKGNDEISDLSRYFNETIEKIKHLIVTIKKQGSELTGTGNELATNMTKTAAVISEMTGNIQNIKTRVMDQSAGVTETGETMEQITINIDKLSGHVEQQSSSVSQSSSAIEQMLANIQSVTNTLINNTENVTELTEASEVGRQGLQEVAADIQEIARESEGLLEINMVMENIASQTNLLSMNAAIEAAHAGESGKGFAVVADEIRKLAENSGKQSKTIGAVLKKIKSSIDKITQSTDDVLNKFEAIENGVKTVARQEENIRGAMEEQGQGSKQILTAIGQVNEITRQVKDSSAEMLLGSNEVINESKQLESVTHEITGGMNEMAAETDQINAAVTKVNEISEKNRENIALLVQEVAKFKVE